MIPLKDNIPIRRFPVVTVALILINVVVFIVDVYTRHYVPALRPVAPGVAQRVLVEVGGLTNRFALVPGALTTETHEAWHTVITSMFLHANWLHIGFNMLYLWIFGPSLEDRLGRPRYALFYFACGFLAAMAHVASGPLSPTPTVGASGAVAGLMGGYLLMFPKAEILTIVPIFVIGTVMDVPVVVVIGFWAVLDFINARYMGGGMMTGGGVAYYAHLGGFAAGLLLILVLGGRRLARTGKPAAVDDAPGA
jgi:membrane associated rhomboid family serine protease